MVNTQAHLVDGGILVAQNQIPGKWVERKCAEKGCKQMLGHWSKNGTWKYPGAKCDKHTRSKKK